MYSQDNFPDHFGVYLPLLFLELSDTEEEEEEEDSRFQEGTRARFRRAGRKNRRVRDIDSALDPTSYNPMP
jgi:hypothetical protein